jgi:hypothetical protein
MQLPRAETCSGPLTAGACSLEIEAATKLAIKNTSEMAIMTSISIRDLLLVALMQ